MAFNVTELKVATSDGQNVRLLESFTYTRNDGCVITVPEGVTSDGASTPPVIWAEVPPFGKYWLAAILHDYMYRNISIPKDFADETFLEAMLSLNVNETMAKAVYEGVRLFGKKAFYEDREDQYKLQF